MLLDKLKRDWNYSDEILNEVSNVFEPASPSGADIALGEANEFLNRMEQEGIESPKKFYPIWCFEHHIESEIDNNPFTI